MTERRIAYNPHHPAQRKELLALLCEAFGNSYLPYYQLQLDTLASASTTALLASSANGTLVAHIQVVTYHALLSHTPEPIKAAYLYAICTKASHRGKGVMQSLLNQVLENLPRHGYQMALLLPASEQLARYYHKFGFKNMEGALYSKVPKNHRPMVVPGAEAQAFLAGAEELDARFAPHPQAPLPLTPFVPLRYPTQWMLHPLLGEVTLPTSTALLSPLT